MSIASTAGGKVLFSGVAIIASPRIMGMGKEQWAMMADVVGIAVAILGLVVLAASKYYQYKLAKDEVLLKGKKS